MEITNAKYTATGSITATINGQEMSIPADPENRHYVAMLEQGVEITPYVEPEPTLDQQEANRRSAYQQEADPLFFKWQRGTATEQEWLDKIAEIKVRYPDPEVSE